MTRSLLGSLVLVISAAFAATGCGSDGASGTGTAAEALASCNAYCDVLLTKACDPSIYDTAAECKTTECDQAARAPSKCQAAIKTYYDCEKSQADLCMDNGCLPQFTALASCQASPSGTAAEALASCHSYCDVLLTKNCDPIIYDSLEMCRAGECDKAAQAPSKCQAAIKTYYDCEKSQADLCMDNGCLPQFTALASCQ